MSALVGLLALGGLAIRVDQTRGIDEDISSAVLEAIARAVELRTGSAPRIDASVWAEPCGVSADCAAAIRARTGAGEVIVVTIVGALTKIRVLATRVDSLDETHAAEVDIPFDRSGWSERFGALVLDLGVVPEALASTIQLIPSPKRSILGLWPHVAGGVGLIAVFSGVAFGVSSAHASDELRSQPLRGGAYLDLAGRAQDHALAANLLYAAGALGVVAGLIMLVFD